MRTYCEFMVQSAEKQPEKTALLQEGQTGHGYKGTLNSPSVLLVVPLYLRLCLPLLLSLQHQLRRSCGWHLPQP